MDNYQLLRTPIPSMVVDDSACDVNDLAKCGGIQVTVPGTDSWPELVHQAAASEWTGIEALGGFDGTVADAVRVNAAAFGQEVGDTLMSVRTWDLQTDAQRTFAWADCRMGEGTSRFAEPLASADADSAHGEAAAGTKLRYEILDVNFLFLQGDLTRPLRDAELARLVDAPLGTRVPLEKVASAVATLDTWH